MAESINNRKLQQSSYLREIQQEKSARKRELMSQQQQDLVSLRQYYADELQKVESESAAAVDNIRQETKDMVQQYSDERRQIQEEERQQKLDARYARQEEQQADSEYASESSVEQSSVYNRRAQKKPMIQNYETKKTDDFYRVQNRGSRVTENNKQYVIEAYSPEHEKDNLRVSIQKNKAVVSGKRKFGDSVQEGNKKMSTNNFQTFREEFKFGRPVSHEGMTRERIGDFVKFTIPKLEAVDSSDDKS